MAVSNRIRENHSMNAHNSLLFQPVPSDSEQSCRLRIDSCAHVQTVGRSYVKAAGGTESMARAICLRNIPSVILRAYFNQSCPMIVRIASIHEKELLRRMLRQYMRELRRFMAISVADILHYPYFDAYWRAGV